MESFDYKFYIDFYKDIQNIGISNYNDAFKHWNNYGKMEGRFCNKLMVLEYDEFDWNFYIENCNIISLNINNKKDAYIHWNNNGIKEYKLCNKKYYEEYINFDWVFYTNIYKDLHNKGLDNKNKAYYHWLYYGRNEGRIYNKEKNNDYINFNWEFYIKIYPELKNIGINNKDASFEHWLNMNINEKKFINEKNYYDYLFFDWEFYINKYDDLKNTLLNKDDAFNHWIEHGEKEGRIFYKIENFDWQFYIKLYNDINYINKEEDALLHYSNIGIKEYRLINSNLLNDYNNFDWEKYKSFYKLDNILNNKEIIFNHWNKIGKNKGFIFFTIQNNNSIKCEESLKYDISIITVYDESYNEIIELLNLFNKLYYNKYNFEVIIIDNNSSINYKLNSIINNYLFKIKYLYINKKEYNTYKLFNKGFNISNSEIIIFQYAGHFHYNDIIKNINRVKLLNNFYIYENNNIYINKDFNKEVIFNANKINDLNIKKLNNLNITGQNINEYNKLIINNEFFNKNDLIENNAHPYNLIKKEHTLNDLIKNKEKFCFIINKYNLDLIEGFDENHNTEYNCFLNFLEKTNNFLNIKYFDKINNFYNIEKNLKKIDNSNMLLENIHYIKTIKKIGIAISVYSDSDTPSNRILASFICLNSIIKNCKNIIIIIVIDKNILDNHLTFIKDLINNNKNIHLYINSKNFGIAKTKNICIKLLEKHNIDYICLLDDDIEIIKDFSEYIINIFNKINIPLLSNYNIEYSFENITFNNINFIKTTKYFGNFIAINSLFIKKYGYFADFKYKWGGDHEDITNRYLSNTKYNNIALNLSEYIVNEQIINGDSTLHLHSFKIDYEKVNDNKILLEKLSNNQKYIDFILNDEDITKII